MKKAIALLLALVVCLSLCTCGNSGACTCDCPQCVQCEQKVQNTDMADASHAAAVLEDAEQDNHTIRFETPVLVAEDDNLRVEVVNFQEEYRLWKNGYPYSAVATAEGASLEKFVVFKFTNKADHALQVSLNDVYLGSDGAYVLQSPPAEEIAVGKNILVDALIQTGEEKTLGSMEELYSLDGNIRIYHKGEDGVLRNPYRLDFSIPDGYAKETGAVSAGNPDGWEQFRDYLKANGPVTAVMDTSSKVTIEENAGNIQISHVIDTSAVIGQIPLHQYCSMQFELPPSATTVTVQEDYLMEGYDENENRREQSGSWSNVWDIQNYRSGDEISFAVEYSDLNNSGEYVQKKGTITATKAYAETADALVQTLAKSGLGVTMADLGFTSY